MRRFAFQNSPTFKGHVGRISALAFSPDGSLLASGGEHDLTICLWRVADGELLHLFNLGEPGPLKWVEGVAFSSDGETLYAVSGTSLRTFSVATGDLLWHRQSSRIVRFLLSPDGRYATHASYVKDQVRTRLIDLATNRFLPVRYPAKPFWLMSGDKVAMVPGTSRLVVANMRQPSQVADFDDPEVQIDLPLGTEYDCQLATEPEGRRVALGDASGTVRLVRTADWSVEKRMLGAGRPVQSIAVSLDNRYLVVASGNWLTRGLRVHLWDLLQREWAGEMIQVKEPRFWRGMDRDGKALVFDRCLLWLGREGSSEFERFEKAITVGGLKGRSGGGEEIWWIDEAIYLRTKGTLALSQNGRWLGMTQGERVYVMDMEERRIVGEMPLPKGCEYGVAVTAITEDGSKIVLAFRESPVESLVFDFTKSQTRDARLGHDISSLAIHPNTFRVAAGYHYEEAISIGDLRRRRRPHDITAHVQPVRGLSYTPDGRTLISAAADGQVILWDAETLERKATLMVLSPMDHFGSNPEWIAFTPGGEFNGSEGAERWFVGRR